MSARELPLELFFSYSHQDEALRDELETHLSLLENEGLIRTWHDRSIEAGQEWEREIDQHLRSADIILLLVSPPFMASRYCRSVEMKEALERHRRGEVRVIPIILRPVDWKSSPIGGLQALPRDAKPVVEWPLRDRAFFEIAIELRRTIAQVTAARPPDSGRDERATGAKNSRRFVASDASDRCIQELKILRPGNPVAMVWSPDGQKIALGTDQETAVLDLRDDGRCIWQSARDTLQLRWSPDGALLAVADSETCAVLEGKNGKTRWSTPNLNGQSLSLSWSPDGRCLACGDYGKVNVRDSSTGRELCQLEAYARGVIWSPHGTCLAIGGMDQLQIWCVTGLEAPSLRDLSIQGAQALAWSPDSSRLAVMCESEVVQVWNVHNDDPDLTLALNSVMSPYSPNAVVWSPRGTWIAVATLPAVQIFNSADGREVLNLPVNLSVMAIDVSPDGLRLASVTPTIATIPSRLQIWDLSDLP